MPPQSWSLDDIFTVLIMGPFLDMEEGMVSMVRERRRERKEEKRFIQELGRTYFNIINNA